MDSKKWPGRYPLPLQVLLSLTACSLLYIIIIRPLRIELNTGVLIPAFISFAGPDSDTIMFMERRIEIQPQGYDRSRGFGIPFGGYFWLPLALFITIRNKKAAIILSLYHLFLAIVPPILGLLFLRQIHWAGTLLRLNEILFHIFFLITLFIGLKGIVEEWVRGR